MRCGRRSNPSAPRPNWRWCRRWPSARPPEGTSPGQQALVQAAGPPATPVIRTEVDEEAQNERSTPGLASKLMFWRKTPPPGIVVDPREGGAAPARERRTRPEPGDRRHADRPAEEAGLAGGDLLAIASDQATPHFVQVGAAPVFRGAGTGDLLCRCGASVLIQGYLPGNFLAIRIQCFRCGAVSTTPGLPEGEILPRSAIAIEPTTDADGHDLRHRRRRMCSPAGTRSRAPTR